MRREHSRHRTTMHDGRFSAVTAGLVERVGILTSVNLDELAQSGAEGRCQALGRIEDSPETAGCFAACGVMVQGGYGALPLTLLATSVVKQLWIWLIGGSWSGWSGFDAALIRSARSCRAGHTGGRCAAPTRTPWWPRWG